MGALTTAYVLVAPDMRTFGKDLKVGLRRVDVTSSGRDAGSRFSSGFQGSTGKALKRGLAGAGVAAGAAFAGALTKGFGRLSAIENAEAKLTGLGHSAKAVDTIMANALASVKGTAFGLDEAATVAATSVASGVKPGKDLQRTLKLVADAATIGGTSLAEMGGIFSDVAASNKVQGDTINQLNERGIPILKLLGDAMGVSQGEVAALASKGKIDFATFQEAMKRGLGGAALDSGKTATGAFKNMGAAFSRVGAALLKGVFPQIGTGFGTITGFLDKITPAAGRFGEAVGTAFSQVAAFVRDRLVPAFADIKARALPGLQVVGDFIRTNVLPALRTLGNFVLTTLLPAWLSWYGFLIRQLTPILKQVGGFIRDSVIPAFKAVAKFIADEVVPAFLDIVETVKGLIRVVAPIIREIVGVIIDKFTEMRPQIQSIWGSVKEIITGVMFIIKEVISSVTAIIKLIWDKWGNGIKKIVGAVFGAIFNVIAGVMKAIAGIIKLVVALIKGDWSGAWNAIKQIFSGVWQAIKGILVAAWTVIKTIFSRSFTFVRGKWDEFWTRIKDGARSAMDWVHTKIVGVLDKIKAAFVTAKDNIKKTWDGVKSVVQTPINWIKDNVYNKPLVPVWNRVAKLVGGPELKEYARGGIADLERYANGGTPFGVRPGYTPGRDTHPIMVGGGEAIMRPEWTRAVGADYVNAANAAARRGSLHGPLDGFAGGGIVGWIKDKLGAAGSAISGLAGKIKGFVLGGLRSAAGAILNPLKGVIDRAMPDTGVGNTVGSIGKKGIDLLLDKIGSADAAAALAAAGSSASWPGGSFRGLSSSQMGIAATIASVGASMGKKAQLIGIITGLVESRLRNVNFGDRDSLGVFQQRAPWGPASVRRNVRASAGMFFHGGRGGQPGLDDIRGWQGMSPGRAAQRVQVSAFPDRYGQQVSLGLKILSALASSKGAAALAGSGAGGSWMGGTRPVPGSASRHSGYPWANWAGDFRASGGTPFRAWRAGTVAAANMWTHSYGRHLRVNHPGGAQTLYAHASALLARRGQRVGQGAIIGRVGSTGNSTGNHLHWEIKGLADGGIVRGGRGGITTRIGEGANDELVSPLPRSWRSRQGGAATATAPRPINIVVDLGDGVTQRVQGVLDANDEFHASVGRMRR